MPALLNPARAALANRLREVRVARWPSQGAFGRALGWPQPRVSKLETGAQTPTEDDLTAWAAAAEAGPVVLAELTDLLAATRLEFLSVRDARRRGMAGYQAARGQAELAGDVAEFQPAIIPGLLQTAPYARELLALPGGVGWHGLPATEQAALVGGRMERQRVLYEGDRHFRFVIGEPALYGRPGTVATMRGQLDRLTTIAGMPHVTVAIVRSTAPLAAMVFGGFALIGESVVVEWLTGEQRTYDPAEVNIYRIVFDELLAAATTGPEAETLIRAAMRRLDSAPDARRTPS